MATTEQVAHVRHLMLAFSALADHNKVNTPRVHPGQIGTVIGIDDVLGEFMVLWGSDHKTESHRVKYADAVSVLMDVGEDGKETPRHFRIGERGGYWKVRVHAGSRCYYAGAGGPGLGSVLAVSPHPSGDRRRDKVLVKFWGFCDDLTFERWELRPVVAV